MRSRLPLIALLLALPLVAHAETPAELSARGKELMAAGRYAEAVPVYRALAEHVPGNPGPLLNLGMALHLSGQNEQAIAPLEAALKAQPSSAPAALVLGAAQMSLGRPAAALPPLQEAVRLQPQNAQARSMLSDALVDLERYGEAEPHLVHLSRARPGDPAIWFVLGKTYEAMAGQAFRQLLERDPESPLALALVAEARLDGGQTTAAFQLYRKALERAPGQRGLHAAVAEVYRRTGHADWAAAEDEKERKLPKADCARDTLECAFAAGRHRDVLSSTSKLATAPALYWRIRSSNALAVAAFERLTALPPSLQSHEWTAGQRRNEGRHAEAAEEWRKALALEPDDPRLKLELAASLRAKQDLAEAQQLLEQVLKAVPGSPEASYLLGDVLVARQQPEAAIPHLETAVTREPQLLEARAVLGRAYALVGRAAEAVPHLVQALPTDQDGSLRLQLGRAYQAAGQAEKAEAALRDYEEFRRASRSDADSGAQGGQITPP